MIMGGKYIAGHADKTGLQYLQSGLFQYFAAGRLSR